MHAATVGWIVTEDEADAILLERRLIEWHRSCVGIAPLAVGWEARKRAAELVSYAGVLAVGFDFYDDLETDASAIRTYESQLAPACCKPPATPTRC